MRVAIDEVEAILQTPETLAKTIDTMVGIVELDSKIVQVPNEVVNLLLKTPASVTEAVWTLIDNIEAISNTSKILE
jgi:hypothetical protein